MAKEKSAVLILLFAIVVIVVMTTMITMQVAEKAAPASKTATAQAKVSFTVLPSEQTTTPAVAQATGRVTFNIIK